jgi:hypothetical protein
MGCCYSRERLLTIAPEPLVEILREETSLEIISPKDIAQNIHAATTVDEACEYIVKELSNVTGSSAILILTDVFLEKSYCSDKEGIELEEKAKLFAMASQLGLDSDKSTSRLLYSHNVASDSRFVSVLPKGQAELEDEAVPNNIFSLLGLSVHLIL